MSSTREQARRPRRALVAGLCAVVLVGCAAPLDASTRTAPTDRAEQWATAYASALRQGVFNVRRFYDEEAVLDLTALGRGTASERDEDVRLIGSAFDVRDADASRDAAGELYLAATGALEQAAFMDQAFQAPHQLVSIEEMSATGIARQTLAVSELAWRSARADDPRILAAHKLALAWAAAWRNGSTADIPALYRADATLRDELVGVEAASGTAIASLVGDRASPVALPGFEITTMPDLAGPAVYVVGSIEWASADPMSQVVVIGSANDGAACPGGVAAVLNLDGAGNIAREQRYHRAGDLARCGLAGAAPRGWWNALTIPAVVAVDPTGVLDVSGQQVAMFNSSPALDGLVAWAYGRFAAAKLPPPAVSRVTFYEPTVDLCRGVAGLAAGDELSMCFTAQRVCVNESCSVFEPSAKGVMLHELGHAWMSTHTKRAVGEAFTEQAGLARWASSDVPWGERGVELAADLMAWALMDTARPLSRKLPAYSCEQLAALYETLTSTPPPASAACADPGTEQAEAPATDRSR